MYSISDRAGCSGEIYDRIYGGLKQVGLQVIKSYNSQFVKHQTKGDLFTEGVLKASYVLRYTH